MQFCRADFVELLLDGEFRRHPTETGRLSVRESAADVA